MTDNLYAPPESKLSKPTEKSVPYRNSFNRSMIISAIILSALIVTNTVLGFILEPTKIYTELVSTLIGISQTILSIYFIKRLRVKNLGTSNEFAATELGVWGYCWRCIVALFTAFILLFVPIILIATATGFALTERTSMLTATVIYGLAMYPVLVFVIWALFSKDRSTQFKKFIAFFRGY